MNKYFLIQIKQTNSNDNIYGHNIWYATVEDGGKMNGYENVY